MLRARYSVVRSICSKSANAIVAISPARPMFARMANWVLLIPAGASFSSYDRPTVRAAIFRLVQTHMIGSGIATVSLAVGHIDADANERSAGQLPDCQGLAEEYGAGGERHGWRQVIYGARAQRSDPDNEGVIDHKGD